MTPARGLSLATAVMTSRASAIPAGSGPAGGTGQQTSPGIPSARVCCATSVQNLKELRPDSAGRSEHLACRPVSFFLLGHPQPASPSAAHFRSLRATTHLEREQVLAFGHLAWRLMNGIEQHAELPACGLPHLPVAPEPRLRLHRGCRPAYAGGCGYKQRADTARRAAAGGNRAWLSARCRSRGWIAWPPGSPRRPGRCLGCAV